MLNIHVYMCVYIYLYFLYILYLIQDNYVWLSVSNIGRYLIIFQPVSCPEIIILWPLSSSLQTCNVFHASVFSYYVFLDVIIYKVSCSCLCYTLCTVDSMFFTAQHLTMECQQISLLMKCFIKDYLQ